MERSDEARRLDGLHNRIGSLVRNNRKQAEKIVELERIIVEANAYVNIMQERNDNLRKQITNLEANNNTAKNQIAAIKAKLLELQTNTNNSLGQIVDNLKLIKLHF